MKILFVDHETRLSGGQHDLVDLVRGLAPRGHDLHVAVPGEGPLADALRRHGARVHVVPMDARLRKVSRWDLARRPWVAVRSGWAAAVTAFTLIRLARELAPDAIHTNTMKAHVLAIPAARRSGVPLVWHVRDILHQRWLRRAFATLAGLVATRVVCLSQVAAEPFTRTRVRNRTRVVYNGIRPAPTAPEEVDAWRRRLGVAGDEPVIGIVGQIARWKGQDVFVEAARELATRHPDARFAVVGECLFPENEGGYERQVRANSEPGDLAGRLTWTGPVAPIEPLMAALDVLVHASRLPEPFGRVIVEAMAQGTPVVSTTVGSGPELVPETTGLLVPPADPAALADALDDLLTDRARLREMGTYARDHAARFDIAATADGVEAVYRELGLPSSSLATGA